MTKISILGCGWLGLPLAKDLVANGYSLKGSTTSIAKISTLQNSGIEPYLITLSENEITGNVIDFLEKSKILIIDIPPKLRGITTESFVKKIENLIPYIEKTSIKKLLFISSTSVYGDSSSVLSVTEETTANPDTESGKQLVQVEQLLQNNVHFKTTIIRFGGLIGEDRNPVKFLARKTNIENPNAPINLIHQADCIGIIIEIIRQFQEGQEIENETFNAVTPFHPSRKEYYTQKAIELKLDLPEFNDKNTVLGKTILSTKIEKKLAYKFKKPNL